MQSWPNLYFFLWYVELKENIRIFNARKSTNWYKYKKGFGKHFFANSAILIKSQQSEYKYWIFLPDEKRVQVKGF